MLDLALAANLPMVQVHTDDLVHLPLVLEHFTLRKALSLTNGKMSGEFVYWTDDPKWATKDTYMNAQKAETTLVLVNMEPCPLAFDAGSMATPAGLVTLELGAFLNSPHLASVLVPILRGLNLKAAKDILKLTEARTGSITVAEVRKTRAMVAPTNQGLTLLDSSLDFYEWPPQIRHWLDLNTPYFQKGTHPLLVPRGLLFNGPPGVGKSTAAKAIADAFGVPLYRLDIASTLDRYIGVSEARLAQSLALVDREAPCVVLLDEVEKTLAAHDDSGVTSRMLSQLLWWLAEHRSRVFTVMTTNDINKLPPELYRQGRMDAVMDLKPLNLPDAKAFGLMVAKNVLGTLSPSQALMVSKAIMDAPRVDPLRDDLPPMAHAAVIETVLTLMKREGWGLTENHHG